MSDCREEDGYALQRWNRRPFMVKIFFPTDIEEQNLKIE